MDGKWMMTLDEENWSTNNFDLFDSEEEILEFINSKTGREIVDTWNDELGDDLSEGTDSIDVYYGQISEYVVGVDVENILENISENAYSECGEYADGYLYDVKKNHQRELEDKLNEVLGEWMKKYKYEPYFYNLTNSTRIEKSL